MRNLNKMDIRTPYWKLMGSSIPWGLIRYKESIDSPGVLPLPIRDSIRILQDNLPTQLLQVARERLWIG